MSRDGSDNQSLSSAALNSFQVTDAPELLSIFSIGSRVIEVPI